MLPLPGEFTLHERVKFTIWKVVKNVCVSSYHPLEGKLFGEE